MIFDEDKDNYLNVNEFHKNMLKIYNSNLDEKMELIFDIYDTDSDKLLSKEEVKLVLSHAPIKVAKKFKSSIDGFINYMDRVESQKELYDVIDLCFGTKEYLTFENFKEITSEINSEMFLCIFSLLETHFPSISQFKRYDQSPRKVQRLVHTPKSSQQCAIPHILNKFSPIDKIVDFFTTKISPNTFSEINYDETDCSEQAEGTTAQVPYVGLICSSSTVIGPKRFLSKIPKKPNDLLSCDHSRKTAGLANVKITSYDILSAPNKSICIETSFEPTLFCECGQDILDVDKLPCQECLKKEDSVNYYGYLFLEDPDFTKYWFCLENKDLYCFETKDSPIHKSMNNLTSCFIKEEEPKEVNKIILYPFSIVYSSINSFKYYAQSKDERNDWINKIKKKINYANIMDFYEFGDIIGKGRLSTVKIGIHKKTGKKVAIKIMNKIEMSKNDLDLMREEIEIMKLCQHPNIVNLLDTFETISTIYIVVEYLESGDLYSYLEKRKFRVPEATAARILHSLAAALYYLHSYGIIHRDIKPENIMITKDSSEIDIKLIDLGLSKIVGPMDLCHDAYGTLTYAAPEILLQNKYSKLVDIWSLGIIAHLMLVGYLPFDHDDDREIAK